MLVGKRVAGVDAHTVPFAPLGQLANYLVAANSEVRAFVANGNPGHIANANANADAALTTLPQVTVPASTDDFVAAKEAAERYRIGLDAALAASQATAGKATGEVEGLRARIAELASELGAEKQRLTNLTSDQQAQFSAAQDARSREWTEDERARSEKFTALTVTHSQSLAEQVTEFSKVRDAARKEHADVLAALRAEFVVSAQQLRSELDVHKAAVEKLVGVIGNLGLTSGHQKAADEARSTSRFWQTLAVIAMSGLISIAVYALVNLTTGEFSWGKFSGRVFASVTFGVLAAYSAAQADKYQKREERNRRMALELEALGPFLAPLPQDKAETFRLSVGERSFGRGEGPSEHAEKSPATALDVLNSKEVGALVISGLRRILKP